MSGDRIHDRPVGEFETKLDELLDQVGISEFEQIVDKWTAHLPGAEWCQAGKAAILAAHTKAVDQARREELEAAEYVYSHLKMGMLTVTVPDSRVVGGVATAFILDPEGRIPKTLSGYFTYRLAALDKDSHR